MNITYTRSALSGLLALALATGMAALAPAAQAQVPACDLDIALVLDSSGSVDDTELASMQASFRSFVDTILVPDTEMTVIDFDDSAVVTQDWTADASLVKSGIDAGTSGGGTNWTEAINTAQGKFPHRQANNPDVMIFASDGNPNEGGGISAATAAADSAKAAGTYIKTVGIGDGLDGANLAAISSDGDFIDSDFDQLEDDLLALAATLCDEVTEENGGGDTHVVNKSAAVVGNTTDSGAYTGKNHAGGSYGGDGGRGGDIRNTGGDQDVDGGEETPSRTGRGGNGGNSNDGGVVESGNAVSEAWTTNVVNRSLTRINHCACNGDDEGKTTVRNDSSAFLANGTAARAKTGYNSADGSVGGGAGRGGDITNRDGMTKEEEEADENEQDLADVRTGNGGDGGRSARGGYVKSGSARSYADTLNTINPVETRIAR